MNSSDHLYFKDFDSFLLWLKENHASETEAFLYIYKKNSKEKGIKYEEAVLAALCYGWIDSIMHSYNDEKYILRFSPRNKNSNWSISNIKRMQKLIESNIMTEFGMARFEIELIEKLPDLIAKEKQKN